MANYKDRPGAKVVQGLPLQEKALAFLRGKASNEAYTFACEIQLEIQRKLWSEFGTSVQRLGREDFASFLETVMSPANKRELLSRAKFFREVARTLERMTESRFDDRTAWLALELSCRDLRGKGL